MKKVEIEIEILPGGDLKCEVSGAPGKACLKYKELLAQILQAEEQKLIKTDEFYQEEVEALGKKALEQRLKRKKK
jgi:hypothetical protein